ncbi:hypothetical protein Tco_1080728 [Tanacetum coccineum]|uniref:Uncharacterized protein n=1 Tax=Tanacetum coccineum TaxID=301880 RepID=A0ABQ5HXG1_9ASTR
MYCSIVSAIAFASSSSEYSWSESRLKSGDLNSSRLRVLKCLLDDQNSHSGVVNDRVTDLATTHRQDAQELYVRCEDAQDDQAFIGAQVSILRRERRYFRSMASSYEREAVIARQAWSHSKSRIQAMEAQIRALQRDVDVLQKQRISAEDRLTAHI